MQCVAPLKISFEDRYANFQSSFLSNQVDVTLLLTISGYVCLLHAAPGDTSHLSDKAGNPIERIIQGVTMSIVATPLCHFRLFYFLPVHAYGKIYTNL